MKIFINTYRSAFYTLTNYGIKQLKQCKEADFHPHEKAEDFYTVCL